MTPPDDIPQDTPPLESKPAAAPAKRLRSVGPESETRGGSEVPETTIGDATGHPAPAGSAASRRDGELPLEPPASPPDGMPGSRAALPEGSLSKPYLEPQGDENRDPAANAPVAPNPNVTVETTRRK